MRSQVPSTNLIKKLIMGHVECSKSVTLAEKKQLGSYICLNTWNPGIITLLHQGSNATIFGLYLVWVNIRYLLWIQHPLLRSQSVKLPIHQSKFYRLTYEFKQNKLLQRISHECREHMEIQEFKIDILRWKKCPKYEIMQKFGLSFAFLSSFLFKSWF